MVADQHVHHAARCPRSRLQPHEEVHCVTRVRTAVENVSDNDEMGGGARPAEFLIQYLRISQRRDQGLVGAVDVGHGDDALDVAVLPLTGNRRDRQMAGHDEND